MSPMPAWPDTIRVVRTPVEALALAAVDRIETLLDRESDAVAEEFRFVRTVKASRHEVYLWTLDGRYREL